MSEGSKSVVGPIYWLYRSFCKPRVRFNNVGPPIFAISSINEFVAPVLDILDSVGRLRLSSLSGDLRFATDSSFPSVFNFLFRGCGLCTNVHSCEWNWHSTQLVCPSLITHLLFLRLHASHGRSFRLLVFVPESADAVLLMLAERCDRILVEVSTEGSRWRGLREAIAMGCVRATVLVLGVDMA